MQRTRSPPSSRPRWERSSALAAGQLVAQCGKRLVRGQGAGPLRVGTRRAVVLAGIALVTCLLGRGISLGACLDDLLLVRLIACPSLGVLPLPLLALAVEALEPLTGLRIEALGVEVVALVVVSGRHAVQGRVEVLAGDVRAAAL